MHHIEFANATGVDPVAVNKALQAAIAGSGTKAEFCARLAGWDYHGDPKVIDQILTDAGLTDEPFGKVQKSFGKITDAAVAKDMAEAVEAVAEAPVEAPVEEPAEVPVENP